MRLIRRRRSQLHEDTMAGARIEKRDASGQALARPLVEEGNTLGPQRSQVSVHVGRAEAEVVEPLPSLGEEARHSGVVARGLEQLDLAVARGEERRPHALIGNLRLAEERQPQGVAPEAIRLREASNHDADVVNVLDHSVSQPRRDDRSAPNPWRRTNLAEPRGNFKRFRPRKSALTRRRRASGTPTSEPARLGRDERPPRRALPTSCPRGRCPLRAWIARTAAPAARRYRDPA